MIHLIGLAGTAGSGKDLATDIICQKFGATNISTSEFVRAVTRHMYDLPHDFNPVRDQLFEVANLLRSIDPAALVKLCIFKAQAQDISIAILSGLRSMGEADAIREAGGIIVGVDADPKIRFERIFARQRDSESQKTYEQFLSQDRFENQGLSKTGQGRGIAYILETADVSLINDIDVAVFSAQIESKLSSYFRK